MNSMHMMLPCSKKSCCYDNIPWELILEILLCLPVATLLRFRSVSKAWRYLIDTQDFIMEHLRHSVKSNAYSKLVLREGFNLYSINLSIVEQQQSISLDSHVLDYHPFDLYTNTDVLGCCNGLICLKSRNRRTLLFNPSTMRYQYMPRLNANVVSPDEVVFGFGYDDVNDDYKLVMLVPSYDDEEFDNFIHYLAYAYSLKSDSWKLIEQRINTKTTDDEISGMFVGGALHWALGRSHNTIIIAFDVVTEEFREVPKPKFIDSAVCNLDVLGGNLCFVCHCCVLCYVDIWVMKEYGVESSWTKLLSISDSRLALVVEQHIRPICYSKCGKKLLVQRGFNDLCWFDIENKDESYVDIHPTFNLIEPYVLVDSLVHLNHSINTKERKGILIL